MFGGLDIFLIVHSCGISILFNVTVIFNNCVILRFVVTGDVCLVISIVICILFM